MSSGWGVRDWKGRDCASARCGVRRAAFRKPKSARNLYDVWLPNLAPSEALIKLAQSAEGDKQWRTFEKRYRAEMRQPEKRHLLDLLAALSRQSNFSVGCYCADENRCHRSILRDLLVDHGAVLAAGEGDMP
jgi:uncharacterized protein YeaO (DUF488 family)